METYRGESARIVTACTLASYNGPDHRDSRMHAVSVIDKFWKVDAKNIAKVHAEKFIEDVWANERFSYLHALGANHNKLVRNGTRMISYWLTAIATNSAEGAAIGTRPTVLQIGTSTTTTHDATYLGCIIPITTGLMAEGAATVTQQTTSTGAPAQIYDLDTLQLAKTFTASVGGPFGVAEMAIRNTDATKIALCRATVSLTSVNPLGTLDATYKLQIVG